MSIIVKNSQLNTETIESINNLIDMDINATIAFKLTRIIKELSSIVEDKVKMEKRILDKYSEKDENGDLVKPLDEQGNIIPGAVKITNTDKFTQEINNLMCVENKIPYDRVNFEDLNLKTAKISDLMKIDFLFI